MSVGKLLLCVCLLSSLLASCGSVHGDLLDKSAEQILGELNINETSYSSLPLCEKIRAYVEVGTYNLDIGHAAVMAPDWMWEGLAKYPVSEVTSCLIDEGERQLSLWNEDLENQTKISFAIHTIFYTLSYDSFKQIPEVRGFMLSAFCEHDLVYSGRLLIRLYVWMKGDLSEEIGPNTDLERLASEEREFVCQALH